MAAALSLPPPPPSAARSLKPSARLQISPPAPLVEIGGRRWRRCSWPAAALPYRRGGGLPARRQKLLPAAAATGPRPDDAALPEMSVESALKLLGVSDGASFEEILRAKNSVLASCKDDMEAVAQVEAAYDMLLLRSLSQRRAGKVANSNIRYADVKSIRSTGTGGMPQWLQKTVKSVPVSVEVPSPSSLGIQAGVYGALMVFTFVNGSSTSSQWPYTGADVPGIILATGFGASLYFLTKKNIGLGKASIITVGGLVIGAVVGSAVENWLHVDVVPFLGIRSPAVIRCLACQTCVDPKRVRCNNHKLIQGVGVLNVPST